MKNRLFESVATAILLGILAAGIQTYIEVKMLRQDVNRIEVYVDQLWKEKR